MKLTPFEQGYAAFLRGDGEWRNPFGEETAPHSRKEWERGWTAAQRKQLERVV